MAKLLKKKINFAPMNIKKRKAMAFKNGGGDFSPVYKTSVEENSSDYQGCFFHLISLIPRHFFFTFFTSLKLG